MNAAGRSWISRSSPAYCQDRSICEVPIIHLHEMPRSQEITESSNIHWATREASWVHGKSALSQLWMHFLLELDCTRSHFLRKQQFVTVGCNKLLQLREAFQISKMLRIHYSIFAFSICDITGHLATFLGQVCMTGSQPSWVGLLHLHFHLTTQKSNAEDFSNHLRFILWRVKNNFTPSPSSHRSNTKNSLLIRCLPYVTFMHFQSHKQQWLSHKSPRLNPAIGIKDISCLCLYSSA